MQATGASISFLRRSRKRGDLKPVIAISMGDKNGIGPEVILKSLRSPRVRSVCSPVLVGSFDVFSFYSRKLGIPASLVGVEKISVEPSSGEIPAEPSPGEVPVLDVFENRDTSGRRRVQVKPGAISAEAGREASAALERTISLCLSGEADAMVTAPVSKEAMFMSGNRFPGQTEMLAMRTGARDVAMMLVAGDVRVALATVHLPIKDVAKAVSTSRVLRKIKIVYNSLRTDFAIHSPRIAVLGLNPHAGEQGHIGKEEERRIRPAINGARRLRMRAEGPFPADGFFGSGAYTRFDAVLAMYHDQGLIPLKLLGFKIGVNFSAGLPIIRTSPDHGTAFDIAGKGKADPESMIQAIRLAALITRNRRGKL
jgi:4-hydroxythreonine-4-phosphate dehydrogenase